MLDSPAAGYRRAARTDRGEDPDAGQVSHPDAPFTKGNKRGPQVSDRAGDNMRRLDLPEYEGQPARGDGERAP